MRPYHTHLARLTDRATVNATTLNTDVATQQLQVSNRTNVVVTRRMLGNAHGVIHRRAFCRTDHSRHRENIVRFYARNQLNFVEVVRWRHHLLKQGIKAVDALFDVFLIVPTIFDYLLHHAIEQHNIRPRTMRQVQLCMFGHVYSFRVCHNQARPVMTNRLFDVRSMIGCADVVSEPIIKITSECLMLGMSLVIAPLPNDASSPVTLDA